MDEILVTLAAILVSLGGGGAIVFALSGWLGKVWADRIMAKDRHQHSQAIEELKSRLSCEIEEYKARLRNWEFAFRREYEAASALVALNYRARVETCGSIYG